MLMKVSPNSKIPKTSEINSYSIVSKAFKKSSTIKRPGDISVWMSQNKL